MALNSTDKTSSIQTKTEKQLLKSPKQNVYPKLEGWTLTSGRISGGETHYQNPSVSEVLASLDTIPSEILNAYVSLGKSPEDAICQNYCLATVMEEGFCCEIRHYGLSNSDYCQHRLILPDEYGSCGENDETRPTYFTGYDPDQTTLIAVLLAFINDPHTLPQIPCWKWVDFTAIVRPLGNGNLGLGAFRDRR